MWVSRFPLALLSSCVSSGRELQGLSDWAGPEQGLGVREGTRQLLVEAVRSRCVWGQTSEHTESVLREKFPEGSGLRGGSSQGPPVWQALCSGGPEATSGLGKGRVCGVLLVRWACRDASWQSSLWAAVALLGRLFWPPPFAANSLHRNPYEKGQWPVFPAIILPPRGTVGLCVNSDTEATQATRSSSPRVCHLSRWDLLPWAGMTAERHGVALCVGSGCWLPTGRWLPFTEWSRCPLLAGEIHAQM